VQTTIVSMAPPLATVVDGERKMKFGAKNSAVAG
jgi:hypothetical protein